MKPHLPDAARTRPSALPFRGVALALALLTLGGCALGGRIPAVDSTAIETRVTRYFRKTTSIPRDASIRLTDLHAAAMPGWQEGRIQVASGDETQSIDFIATNDGRYLLVGQVVDLDVDPVQTTLAQLTLEGQPVQGDPAAPVTIVVFADFQCPFCAKSSRSIERRLVDHYDGKAKLVFKNLPLHQIHSWADTAAIAGECAFQQSNEVFWAVHASFFEQQSQISNRNLREVATRAVQKAGGDPRRFSECLHSRATEAAVSADVREAAALGVKSTPTFFINGRRVTGTQPFEGFVALVDEELSTGK